jgi:hypothetical protein
MATNIYRSESRIYFDAKPAIYYGWYACGSAWSVDGTMFHTEEKRDAYIKEVGEKIKFDTNRWEAEDVAALMALNASAGENYGDEAVTREILAEDVLDADNDDAWDELSEIFHRHYI